MRSAFLLLFAFTACAQQGSVIGITGTWTENGSPLTIGSSVGLRAQLLGEAGSTIMVGFPPQGQFPGGRYFKRCDQSCELFLNREKPQSASDSFLGRLIAAVQGHKEASLIAAVSRGEIGRNLSDAVVPIANGTVDLAPAFRDVLAGSYRVQLKPEASVKVEWAPGKHLEIAAGPLHPGLHTIVLIGENGEAESQADVLLVTPAAYAEKNVAYQHAVETVSAWSDDPEAMRPALRAFLASLADGRK